MQHEIQCDKCRFNGRFQPTLLGHHYVLPDSTKLKMLPGDYDVGWCSACGTITEVERITPIEQYRSTVTGLEKKRRKYPNDSLLAEVLERAKGMVQWRELRKAPPRCLRCGSTEVELWGLSHALTCSPGTAPHPGCGGTLRKTGEWPMFDWECLREVLYTVDGEQITTISSAVLGTASGFLWAARNTLSRLRNGGSQGRS
jgi:hypothetical protein